LRRMSRSPAVEVSVCVHDIAADGRSSRRSIV
jgi:hypothetical protein